MISGNWADSSDLWRYVLEENDIEGTGPAPLTHKWLGRQSEELIKFIFKRIKLIHESQIIKCRPDISTADIHKSIEIVFTLFLLASNCAWPNDSWP